MKNTYTKHLLTALILLSMIALIPVYASGETAHVYNTVLESIKNGDLPAFYESASARLKREIDDTPEAECEKNMAMLKKSVPVEYSVISEEIKDGKARLLLSGTVADPMTGGEKKGWGAISFVNEDGNWKFDGSDWDISGKSDKHPEIEKTGEDS